MGYSVETMDGTVGHVSGFMVDDKSWSIRDVMVECGHWYSGKEVLIAPGKVQKISFEESKFFVNLTKEEIQRTPDHDLAQSESKNLGARGFVD